MAIAALLGLGGTTAWSSTGVMEYFLVGLFFAAASLAYLLETHFNTYNPRRSPVETERLLEEMNRKQQDNEINTATFNGWMLALASLLFLAVSAVTRTENGILIGTIGGLMFPVGGSLSIAWGRSSQRRLTAKREADIDRARLN